MGTSTGGEWSQAESSLHINCLELLAGAFAVKTFTKGKARMTVRLLMDNVSAAHYINKKGRGRISPRSAKCSGRQGVQSNVGSSRLEARPPGVFHNKSVVGPTRGRPLCFPVDNPAPKILQLETRPTGRGLRCIYPGVEQGEGICLPSICSIVGRCLKKLLDQSVPFLVLIAPLWQSQPWYPLLLQSCIAAPILLPHYQGLLTRQMEMHPLDNLQLAGWLLSANHTLKQAFHNQLKNCCWQHGAKAQQLPMLPLGESGIAGVVSGKLVQFMPQ